MSDSQKKQMNSQDAERAKAEAELESRSAPGGPGSVRIRQKDMAVAAYAYMLLPIAVFLVTWLKLWLGLLLLAVLGYGFIRIVRGDYYAGKPLYFRWESLVLLAVGICLWCWLAGQGGWYFQTEDNHWRNAIFRDLITHEWPVIYEADGSALVYYLMQWILPALVGKAFGWTAANAALFAWDALGIMIALMALLFYLKKSETKKCLLVLLLFVCWGGLHLVPQVLWEVLRGVPFDVLSTGDRWTVAWIDYPYQYSANMTLLQWVYNQSIVPWVAVSLLLLAPRLDTFMFLGFCVLPYAPLPFVGFVLLMLGVGLRELVICIREKAPMRFFRQVFSAPNVVALLTLFPVFGAYFGCNSMATGADGVGGIGLYAPLSSFGFRRIRVYVLFLLIEFGIYALLIGHRYKREPLFLGAVISLVFIPLFRIGGGLDFCMRASIPALTVLFAFVARYLFEEWRMNARIILLVICLTFSSCDLIGGLGEATRHVIQAGNIRLPADSVGSLENYPLGLMEDKIDQFPNFNFNYCCYDPDNTIFYKYMAK